MNKMKTKMKKLDSVAKEIGVGRFFLIIFFVVFVLELSLRSQFVKYGIWLELLVMLPAVAITLLLLSYYVSRKKQ